MPFSNGSLNLPPRVLMASVAASLIAIKSNKLGSSLPTYAQVPDADTLPARVPKLASADASYVKDTLSIPGLLLYNECSKEETTSFQSFFSIFSTHHVSRTRAFVFAAFVALGLAPLMFMQGIAYAAAGRFTITHIIEPAHPAPRVLTVHIVLSIFVGSAIVGVPTILCAIYDVGRRRRGGWRVAREAGSEIVAILRWAIVFWIGVPILATSAGFAVVPAAGGIIEAGRVIAVGSVAVRNTDDE